MYLPKRDELLLFTVLALPNASRTAAQHQQQHQHQTAEKSENGGIRHATQQAGTNSLGLDESMRSLTRTTSALLPDTPEMYCKTRAQRLRSRQARELGKNSPCHLHENLGRLRLARAGLARDDDALVLAEVDHRRVRIVGLRASE